MKRLLEGDGSDIERNLLNALRTERPSAAMEERMRATIGLGPIPAAVADPSGPTAAPLPTAAPAAKTFGGWAAVAAGSAAVALLVGGALWLSGGSTPKAPPAPAPAPVHVAAPSEAEPSTPPVISAPDLEVSEPSVAPAPGKPRAPHTATPSSASLREEIRLIDSARVAVKANEGARALEILDRYTRRFPDGSFKQEARVLRGEALKKR